MITQQVFYLLLLWLSARQVKTFTYVHSCSSSCRSRATDTRHNSNLLLPLVFVVAAVVWLHDNVVVYHYVNPLHSAMLRVRNATTENIETNTSKQHTITLNHYCLCNNLHTFATKTAMFSKSSPMSTDIILRFAMSGSRRLAPRRTALQWPPGPTCRQL